MENNNPKIVPYLIVFAGYTLLLLTIGNSITYGLGIDTGVSSDIAIVFLANIATAWKFVQDNKRTPNQSEKLCLSLGCLACTFAIVGIFSVTLLYILSGDTAAMTISTMLTSISPVIWGMILVVAAAAYYIALSLIFGWFAEQMELKSDSVY